MKRLREVDPNLFANLQKYLDEEFLRMRKKS